jgi:hypothetical protein
MWHAGLQRLADRLGAVSVVESQAPRDESLLEETQVERRDPPQQKEQRAR